MAHAASVARVDELTDEQIIEMGMRRGFVAGASLVFWLSLSRRYGRNKAAAVVCLLVATAAVGALMIQGMVAR